MQIGERADAQLGQQLPIAEAEPLPHVRRGVLAEDMLAAGSGGDQVKDRLAMVAAGDELPAAVQGDGAARLADVGRKAVGRLVHRLGGIEHLGHGGELLRHLRLAQRGSAHQREQRLVEIEPTVGGQELARRQIAQPHGGVLEPGGEQHVRREAAAKEPGGRLLVKGRGLVQRAEEAERLVLGMLAALSHPAAPGIVSLDGGLEGGELAAGSSRMFGRLKLAARKESPRTRSADCSSAPGT